MSQFLYLGSYSHNVYSIFRSVFTGFKDYVILDLLRLAETEVASRFDDLKIAESMNTNEFESAFEIAFVLFSLYVFVYYEDNLLYTRISNYDELLTGIVGCVLNSLPIDTALWLSFHFEEGLDTEWVLDSVEDFIPQRVNSLKTDSCTVPSDIPIHIKSNRFLPMFKYITNLLRQGSEMTPLTPENEYE